MVNTRELVRGRVALRKLFRPEEVVFAILAAALLALMLATGVRRFSGFDHPRFFQIGAVLMVAIFARAFILETRQGRAALRPALASSFLVLRDFFPFLGVTLLYEMLHDLTPLLRPNPIDRYLIAIDHALFHVDVPLWIGSFATPWLTRAMVFFYGSYYAIPALFASILYWNREQRLFRDFMVSGVVATVLGYVGYLLVPAVGPYVYQAELFPTRLPGGGPETHLFIAAIDSLRGVARDCFPSLHTANTCVVLAFSWCYRRRLFALYLPIALGLFVSTVYLRMHYVVDVFGGFATAAAAVYLGPRLDRWWYRYRGTRLGAEIGADAELARRRCD